MGRASYRDLDKAAEGHASRPVDLKGPFVTTAEHQRAVTDLTRYYEQRLLEVRKRLGDPTLDTPAAAAAPSSDGRPPAAVEVQAVAPPKPTAGELEALRNRASELKVQFGLSWDETRLRAEIERAQKALDARSGKKAKAKGR